MKAELIPNEPVIYTLAIDLREDEIYSLCDIFESCVLRPGSVKLSEHQYDEVRTIVTCLQNFMSKG